MNQQYDYCDTYDSYGNGEVSDNNQIKTFSCNVCKQSKLVLKKSVAHPVFRCDECIRQSQDPDDEEIKLQKSWWRWF